MIVGKVTNKALWRVYLLGRWGECGTLGYVIASSKNFDWIKRGVYIACDVVKYL